MLTPRARLGTFGQGKRVFFGTLRHQRRHGCERPSAVRKLAVCVTPQRQLRCAVPREPLRFLRIGAPPHQPTDIGVPQRVEVGHLPRAVLAAQESRSLALCPIRWRRGLGKPLATGNGKVCAKHRRALARVEPEARLAGRAPHKPRPQVLCDFRRQRLNVAPAVLAALGCHYHDGRGAVQGEGLRRQARKLRRPKAACDCEKIEAHAVRPAHAAHDAIAFRRVQQGHDLTRRKLPPRVPTIRRRIVALHGRQAVVAAAAFVAQPLAESLDGSHVVKAGLKGKPVAVVEPPRSPLEGRRVKVADSLRTRHAEKAQDAVAAQVDVLVSALRAAQGSAPVLYVLADRRPLGSGPLRFARVRQAAPRESPLAVQFRRKLFRQAQVTEGAPPATDALRIVVVNPVLGAALRTVDARHDSPPMRDW